MGIGIDEWRLVRYDKIVKSFGLKHPGALRRYGGDQMKFTKMHGISNDYVYVNCLEAAVPDPVRTARIVSDRRCGIGSDGLILICPSEVADFKMEIYNADGSQAEMCGNGIRCVGKYVYDRHLTDRTTITVETLAGVKTLELDVQNGVVERVTVDMGEPVLQPSRIPVLAEGDRFVDMPVEVAGKEYHITCVSMGNPHAVVFLPEIDTMDLEKIGPAFENHALFPKRINTEFIRVIDAHTLQMRVWERGAGETWACGTGATASLVAAVLNGLTGRQAELRLRGGNLNIRWDEATNHVFMTGPAAFVFDGEIEL